MRYQDVRDIRSGCVVSDLNGYYDSQNVVRVNVHGPITAVLHHSPNREGGRGLSLNCVLSYDDGVTWTDLAPIEGSLEKCSHDGYQLVHKERIYLFYGFNEHGLTHTPDGTLMVRNDMQLKEGYYVRWSDDYGRTWSDTRLTIPVRRTEIDNMNPWAGEVMGMFMCDKPSVVDGAVYMAFQKTADALGETIPSEAFLLRSQNFLEDPENAVWETLPEGEKGLQSPEGSLGEEAHVLKLDCKGRLCCLWRSQLGAMSCAYSSDGGRSWEDSFWMTYEGWPGGRVMKNPRGAITPHRLRNGTYILCFYNNGHTEREGYTGRRILWASLGRVVQRADAFEEVIEWSQPEILLYHHGPVLDEREDWSIDWAIVDGPGYIDWFEDFEEKGGVLCFIESNKLAVRLHSVSPELLQGLSLQLAQKRCSLERPVFSWEPPSSASKRAPVLPDIGARAGFSIHLEINSAALEAAKGGVLLDATSEVVAAQDDEAAGTIVKGLKLLWDTDRRELLLSVQDGWKESFQLPSDPLPKSDRVRHVSFIVDGAAMVASVVMDCLLCDGGDRRPQGWLHIPKGMLGELGGACWRREGDGMEVVKKVELYDRALLTSEAISFALE